MEFVSSRLLNEGYGVDIENGQTNSKLPKSIKSTGKHTSPRYIIFFILKREFIVLTLIDGIIFCLLQNERVILQLNLKIQKR